MDKTWTEHETFQLAPPLGTFTEARDFRIQPLFTWKETNGHWELKGVYKLMVKAAVDAEATGELEIPTTATLIDDVDQQEEGVYFEYALPFQIVVAAEKVAAGTTPEFHVTKHSSAVDEGAVACQWEACVRYEPATIEKEASSYFEESFEIQELLDSTIEHIEENYVVFDQNALPPWKDTYTTYTIPLRSHHGGT
ncbi:hypothetical protein MKY84_07450 [Chryseomicrobium sp. FSL W7-1435]|uniref:hypothetical protein n=1 Tax=Chryseomicrobium sp. FSL W7-1435 TaxID=2921704 RepID=UPI00315A8D8F